VAISLVDIFDIKHFNIAADAVLGAKFQNFLGFRNATDQRARQYAAIHNQVARMECRFNRLDQPHLIVGHNKLHASASV